MIGENCDLAVVSAEITKLWPELNASQYFGSHSYTSTYYFYHES